MRRLGKRIKCLVCGSPMTKKGEWWVCRNGHADLEF